MKLLLGVVAGAAVVYFLGTDKGKELVGQIKKGASDIAGDCVNKAMDLFGKAKDKAAEMV